MLKKFASKYGKKFLNKEISVPKRIKNVESRLDQSKYGKILKKEANKQLSDKIIPAVVDVAESKIADKITSLKVFDKEKPQEKIEEGKEIIISPHKRLHIINDLRLFKTL